MGTTTQFTHEQAIRLLVEIAMVQIQEAEHGYLAMLEAGECTLAGCIEGLLRTKVKAAALIIGKDRAAQVEDTLRTLVEIGPD